MYPTAALFLLRAWSLADNTIYYYFKGMIVMKKRRLGSRGPLVTQLCFGTLPMGPLQAHISVEEGEELLRYALKRGINFIDTAENYGSYKYMVKAIHEWGRDKVVIASKSNKADYASIEAEIQKGLRELQIEHFDIFHLHGAREREPFSKRKDALQCLIDYKEKGIVRSIGIATHSVKVVKEAVEQDAIDVVFALINRIGKGLLDGSVDEMLGALEEVDRAGKGVYAMKILAGGSLIQELEESINYFRGLDFIHSIALGMVKKDEIDANLHLFEGRELPSNLKKGLKNQKRVLIMRHLCVKCENCVEECPNSALSLGSEGIEVDYDKCITCGYCVRVCPQFCIRVT